MARQIHLALLCSGAGNHVAGWRMPDAEYGSKNIDLLIRSVRIAGAAHFDIAVFADSVYCAPDGPAKNSLRFEPLTLLGALAVRTAKIGLAATVSATYSQPCNVARAFASLDRMSKGRVAWNVVTATNFGAAPFPDHATRYGVTEEFLIFTKRL